MKLKQIPKTDLDYIELYAEKLRENPKFFKQQKELIESQLKSSSALTKKRFSKKDFKDKVRIHLKKIKVFS
ncbi:hypothetical protein KAJ87_01155 [Candidatus Pacearchaeota archaeon]|nr:hypothetical protein [Candidatus Pacearchaeota archaeon]